MTVTTGHPNVAAQSDERALFGRIQKGDRDALRTLYASHHVAVCWAAYGVLQSTTDAEEITTDAFMTLWTKRASIEIVGLSVLPWLVTTSRYLALNRFRAVQRRATEPLDEDSDLPARALSVEDQLIAKAASDALDTLVTHLHPTDQSIFQLCLLEGLTYKEAARDLDLTHASVRNRLSRMKQHLRTELSPFKGH